MSMSTIRGRIARRVLINLRIRPEFVQKLLPSTFEPRVVDGWAIGGICLIRLEQVRLPWAPTICSISSENSAIRFACLSKKSGADKVPVAFLARRETDSVITAVAGKMCFPAELNLGSFYVHESGENIEIGVESQDHKADLYVKVRLAEQLQDGSVFKTIDQLSEFFRESDVGYSPRRGNRNLDAVRLDADSWSGVPLKVEAFESSYFANTELFPPGSVEIDSAFLMRNIEHRWTKVSSNVCCA